MRFAIVRWGNEAQECSVGYDFLKKILHFWNGKLVKIEDYSKPRVRNLRRSGVFVKDMTLGQQLPPESSFVPRNYEVASLLQVRKRL